MFDLNIGFKIHMITDVTDLEEDKERPEAEEKTDFAKELDKSVRIARCRQVICHTTGHHHLHRDSHKYWDTSLKSLPIE